MKYERKKDENWFQIMHLKGTTFTYDGHPAIQMSVNFVFEKGISTLIMILLSDLLCIYTFINCH